MIAAIVVATVLSQSSIYATFKSSNQDNSTTSYADVSDLSVEVGANDTYAIQWFLTASAAATTTGIQLAVNGPASPTLFVATILCYTAVGTPVVTNVTAYDTGLDLTSSAGTAPVNCTITVNLINGSTAGVVAARVRSEVDTSAVTIYAGSRVVYTVPTN